MYHGGTIFGKAINKPNELANTMLGYYIVTFFGGPKFLFRMLPVSGLDAPFQFDETQKIIDCIKDAGGRIFCIIGDNNRVNQAIFASFDRAKPSITKQGIYLLFDFVHIIKTIRNNWIIEKSQELEFSDGGVLQTARWSDIINVFKSEQNKLVKPSKLTEVSVFPKPIERQ